jgi:NAD(P)H-nitrite reductase large subunit
MNGVDIFLNDEVLDFKGENNRVKSVLLKSQKEILTDIVIITIGMKPNIDFLKDSGIKVDKGIIVNEYLKTNIPNIYAAGDVAQIQDPLFNSPILHPTWGYAKKQGKIAAKNMVGNKKKYDGAISIQSIKLNDFRAIAVGMTHSKKNFDEISWVSFKKGMCRKFVLRDNKLIGVLLLEKKLNKKQIKPILEKAVFNMIDINGYKTELLDDPYILTKISEKTQLAN